MLCDEQIKKDLLKINFENYTFVPNEFNDNGGDLIGFHTLENNLTFLGGVAGGDCQTPIFYIIIKN